MEPSPESPPDPWQTLSRFVRRLLSLGENRLELLALEVQEGRDRLFKDFLLALAVAGFALLALLAGSAALMMRFWASSPASALLGLTGLYGAISTGLFLWLHRRLRQYKFWT